MGAILDTTREHIENAAMKAAGYTVGHQRSQAVEAILRNLLRTSLVVLTAVVAMRDPKFGSTLGAVGGLTDSFQSFIVPIIVYFYVNRKKIGTAGDFIIHFTIF